MEAIWFPPSLDCSSDGSFALSDDQRFAGGHSVTFCLYDDEFLDRRSESRWWPNVVSVGLHEFAHVWIYDHLSAADRVAFTQRAGVSAWRTGVNEHVCDDGSGAFVAAENQERGDWEVRSGTGRYSGMSGAGSASFVVDLQANPSVVYIVAELTSPL